MSGWSDRAACRGEDPELFFPVGEGKAFEAQTKRAVRVCRRCDVTQDCLNSALELGSIGVWGGTTDDDRRKLRRRLTRKPAA